MIELGNRWLAGFMDVASSFVLVKTKNSVYSKILVRRVNFDIVNAIKLKYGGNIMSIPVKRNYKITFPVNRISYSYYLSNKSCLGLLNDIYPYLQLKKNHADVLYELNKLILKHGQYKQVSKEFLEQRKVKLHLLFDQMKVLNERGIKENK